MTESATVEDIKNLTRKDFLNKYVTLDETQEMTYLNWVSNEALRVMAPAPSSSQIVLSQDSRVGNYDIKAGQSMMVLIHGLAFNPAEW